MKLFEKWWWKQLFCFNHDWRTTSIVDGWCKQKCVKCGKKRIPNIIDVEPIP